MKENELLNRCLKNDRKAQQKLYERFGPVMKAVCQRYLYERSLAEEVMNRGFLKVFTKLKDYRHEGSLEGWIRIIMVRESLNENQKFRPSFELDREGEYEYLKSYPTAESEHNTDYILKLIEALPLGYKTIFNMNEIEGYSHAEIAKELGISESASRSQLARAKKLLREKLKTTKAL